MNDEWVAGPPPWWRRFFLLPVARVGVRPILWWFGPVRVLGRRRVPRRSGLLILANHRSSMDPILVQYACPRPIRYLANVILFDMPAISRWIRLFGAYPIHRDRVDRKALKFTADLLKAGQPVIVFPEGGHTPTDAMVPLERGIELIVRMAGGVDVICLGIRGAARMMPYDSMKLQRAGKRVEVEWGTVRHFDSRAEGLMEWAASELARLSQS